MRRRWRFVAGAGGLIAAACVGSTESTSRGDPCPEATADPPALQPIEPVAAPWRVGTVGARAGLVTGGDIFFDEQEDIDRQLDVAAATGARWIRVDVDWTYAEPSPGRFSWCRTDRVVVGALERGLEVLALVTYSPEWASGISELHGAPEDPAAFARFATKAVQRYEPVGVHTWEVWNEPNLQDFWRPNPDPEAYAELLAAAGTAIHTADPDSFVITAGLAPAPDTDDGAYLSPTTFLERFYEHADPSSYDAVATHPYSYPAHPTGSQDWNPFAHLDALRDLMVDNGDRDKELWLTEYGAPTGFGDGAVTDPVQADFVGEAFDEAATHPWVGPVFWYTIRDGGTDDLDVFQNFGLVRRNYTPKPALAAFTTEMGAADLG